MELTDRQAREIEYHREHARHFDGLSKPFDFSVCEHPERRWWNGYWRMFVELKSIGVQGKRVLVVGCGFGDDALRLAKMGADVFAFDLSTESLQIARNLAEREGLAVHFDVMPSERLTYADGFFDLILCRDILHHVDIEPTAAELRRVARLGAVFVINEIYSHSWTELVRRSRFVDGWLYPRMQRLIYGPDKPYITADERKMTEEDMAMATRELHVHRESYFNFLVNRVVPDHVPLAKADRLLMKVLAPLGRRLAGRVLLVAER